VQQADNSLQAIQKLGVLHGDSKPGNMTWNEENGRVMFIDFEQATLQPQ
jgi:Ser/Thr protein kinase RdoA (MazF antagonist)